MKTVLLALKVSPFGRQSLLDFTIHLFASFGSFFVGLGLNVNSYVIQPDIDVANRALLPKRLNNWM